MATQSQEKLEKSLERAQALGAYSQTLKIPNIIEYLETRRQQAKSTERKKELANFASTFKALASPKRLELLSLLTTGEKCVSELQYVLEVSNPGVSQHLNVLLKAGLISTKKRAQYTVVKLEFAALHSQFQNLLKGALNENPD
ncbi:MAG: ArsR/SmtB family transcription factor [Candidatus Heimdallarchaeota archaeon]